MTPIGYMYYCIHAFVKMTPQRRDAEAWAGVFPAVFFVMHGLAAYFAYSWMTGRPMIPSDAMKLFALAGLFALIVGGFVYFVMRRNGDRILRELSARKAVKRPALIGFMIFIWTMISPLVLVGLRTFLS